MAKLDPTTFIKESKGRDIANLQPDTVLSVFHATPLKTTAREFCLNGFDSTKPVNDRNTDNFGNILPGLFVSPSFQVASRFGSIVIKFKVLGKYLHTSCGNVTDSLLHGNKNRKFDSRNIFCSEAMFKGILRPDSIECVYWIMKPSAGDENKPFIKLTREEFLKQTDSGIPFKTPNKLVNTHPKSSESV